VRFWGIEVGRHGVKGERSQTYADCCEMETPQEGVCAMYGKDSQVGEGRGIPCGCLERKKQRNTRPWGLEKMFSCD